MTEPKHLILARRAKFVAAAVASAGMVSACGASEAQSPADATSETSADTSPSPCLRTVPPDTGLVDGGADVSDTNPTPCLDVAVDSGTADGSDGGE